MLDWVPSAPYTAEQLLEVLRILRDPENGCPWDKEQTFATIAPYTLEETYEVLDAIQREDFDDLRGELGDLLFQEVTCGIAASCVVIAGHRVNLLEGICR